MSRKRLSTCIETNSSVRTEHHGERQEFDDRNSDPLGSFSTAPGSAEAHAALALFGVRIKEIQYEHPGPLVFVGVAHLSTAIQHSGPSGVAGTVAAAVSFIIAVIKGKGSACCVTGVLVGPTPGDGRGPRVEKTVASV
jgi:hypothetical protein